MRQYVGGRCLGMTKAGRRCRWPAEVVAGGIAVCPFHVGYARRLYASVKPRLPQEIVDAVNRNHDQ